MMELPGLGAAFGRDRPEFWVRQADDGPATRAHVALRADRAEEVQAFHRAGMAAGGADNGAPGLRPQYHPNYYGAFVLDPDGNNIEAVSHAGDA
jgi:catechol 2,3-dioxygenase-like lactoylglutathione lyase family enzyme